MLTGMGPMPMDRRLLGLVCPAADRVRRSPHFEVIVEFERITTVRAVTLRNLHRFRYIELKEH